MAEAKPKKKRKIVRWIILGLVLVLIGYLVFTGIAAAKIASIPMVTTIDVSKKDLINSIDVDGVVESINTERVFAKLTLPVVENMVEVGDKVKAGDTLCTLDTESIEKTIATQRASANASSSSSGRSIEMARKQYEQAKTDIAGDKQSQIIAAELQVKQAEQAVEKAGLSFQGAADASRNNPKPDGYDGTEDISAMDDADRAYKTQKDGLVNQRELAYQSYENAKVALEDAKRNLEVVKGSVDVQLESYQDSIRTAQITAQAANTQWVSIAQLEADLEKAIVTAPTDGVVTAVYVTEGATVTGLMYVIEDVDNLKVTTTVKEYDIPFIKEGLPVEIKSDISGEDIYDGNVAKIAPTSVKNATGDSASATDPQFVTEVNVPSTKTNLRIGTKARMSIVYDSISDVLAVPFSALGVNEAGEDVVYVLEEGEKGILTAKAIPVTIGLDSDSYSQITGDGITEGLKIINDVQNITNGMIVQIMPDALVQYKEQLAAGGGAGTTVVVGG